MSIVIFLEVIFAIRKHLAFTSWSILERMKTARISWRNQLLNHHMPSAFLLMIPMRRMMFGRLLIQKLGFTNLEILHLKLHFNNPSRFCHVDDSCFSNHFLNALCFVNVS